MDNTNNEQSVAELMLATARKSVIITNLSLSEAMETGMMVQYESFGEVPCVCVMGLRPNSTALICCNDGDSNKIYLQYVAIEKENGFHMKYNTQIYNNNDADVADRVWANLLCDLELWSKGELDNIFLA